jgi:hypothetical protein
MLQKRLSMTAGQVARIYLGQGGEGCKHGWVSLAGGSRALRLAARNRGWLGLAEAKGNKHGWTAYKFKMLDWLYISLHVQKPKVFTTALAAVPLGCVILKRAGEAGLDVIHDRRLTWSKRRRGTRRRMILISRWCLHPARSRVVFTGDGRWLCTYVPSIC